MTDSRSGYGSNHDQTQGRFEDSSLDASPQAYQNDGAQLKKSKLNLTDAFAVLVSHQIGSGIFSSPSQVDKNVPAPGFALLIWLVSGLLAWSGATSFAELGGALPLNGGTQEYLNYVFGDGMGFIYAWIVILATRPCSITVQAIVFSQYWINVVFGATDSPPTVWYGKVLAIAAVYIIIAFNMISMKATARMMRFFTMVKFLTLFLLFVLTLLTLVFHIHQGQGTPNQDWYQKDWFGITNPNWRSGILDGAGQTTIAIYAGLWGYSGWDSANMVAGDIQNPGRNLPIALNLAMPSVITSFIIANICYYIVVPWADIDSSNTIAVSVGSMVIGWPGSVTFAVLVSLACLGSMNVNVFAVSRQVVSAAQSHWLPAGLGKYSSPYQSQPSKRPEEEPLVVSSDTSLAQNLPPTPIRAMLFTAAITTLYILFGTFGSLVTSIGLTEYTFSCIATIGLLILRRREPHLPRPYKPSAIIPILFVIVSATMIIIGCASAIVPAVVLVVLIAAGILRKYTTRILRRKSSPVEGQDSQ